MSRGARPTVGWIPLVILSALGMSGPPTLPIWLTGAAQLFRLTPSQTGLIASLELGCLALSSIGWAVTARAQRSAAWLVGTLLLAIAGNAASYLATDATGLVIARVIVGLCYGIILSEITRRAARMPDPHRVFTAQQLGLVLFVSAFFATVPGAIAATGPLAPFLYNGALSIAALASLIWLPSSAADPAAHTADSGNGPSHGKARPAMALVALGLVYLTQSALWTYITEAARHAGVPLDTLSRLLAIGAVTNLMVPIAAERIGLRWGRVAPLLIGFAGLTTSILLVSLPFGATWFAAGAIGLNLFLLFLTPFLLGALAALDASGRSASAGPAFFTFGGAIGPAAAGLILGGAGMLQLGLAMAGVAILALGLALCAVVRLSTRVGPSAVLQP